ncbi:hypothetical protein [Polynucleobacter sp.]|jgi:hypothetical protein|uniref:hypothetical protein n=1 Tax=Polynucleobacter sp. TaxID=2029855 RepID=UPI003F6A05E2
MGLFTRKPKPEPIVVTPPATSRVEVELHKNASEKAAQKAIEVNQHLKELYVENGFTLKIYLAAGGQLHQKKGGK